MRLIRTGLLHNPFIIRADVALMTILNDLRCRRTELVSKWMQDRFRYIPAESLEYQHKF